MNILCELKKGLIVLVGRFALGKTTLALYSKFYFKNVCAKNRNNLKLVIIDYFQLINKSIKTEEKIIDELNLLSEQYNIPIIITSKLSRIPENKTPVLDDFKTKYLVKKSEKVNG